MARSTTGVEVHGVRITHPDKVLWPADGITKLELAQYYEALAPVLLRYAAYRPLTLRPFPRGIARPGFYLKDAPRGTPGWIERFRDVAESTGEPVHFVVARDARTLVWLAQYNAVEVHPWLSRTDDPDHPDWAVVDLDPPDASHWPAVAEGGRLVRRWLERRGLQGFPKLSGSKGLHVLVPLERVHTFEAVRACFEGLARDVAQEQPALLTWEYRTRERGGRVLVDYAQNARAKTTVAPYSVRPLPGAPVSAPITWDELDEPGLRSNAWTLRQMRARLDTVGDLLEPALALRQRLPSV